MRCATSCCARYRSARTATSASTRLVQRYNSDLANGYGNLVSRVVNMVHKYIGGIVPERELTQRPRRLCAKARARAIAEFGPAFDELDFSEALKSLWNLVAETDGYLTANAPWKKPADRSEADHAALQARVLANAAEAIRIITALVYPITARRGIQSAGSSLGRAKSPTLRKAPSSPTLRGRIEAGTRLGEPAPAVPPR